MTMDLSPFINLATLSLAKHPIPDGSHGWEDLADGALVRGLAAAVLTLCAERDAVKAELEQAREQLRLAMMFVPKE